MTLDQDPRVPTPAEKEEMIGLIKEFREIMIKIAREQYKPTFERDKTIARLQEIKNKMLHFKMRYPNG